MTRHLIGAVFLAVAFPAAAAMTATPYSARGAPGTYVRPAPPKDQARLPQPTPLVRAVRAVPVEAIKPQVAALSELVAAPWPCERIRKAVEQYGRDTVKNYARARGYTKKQIDEAMACVPEKRT